MASKSTATQDGPQYTEKYNPVKSLLISQPKPEEKSPYYELEQKWNLKIDWRPFIQVDNVSEKEFRKNRINLGDFPCVILNSKGAVDNFFRLAEETRARISQDTRYFCLTEAIANYLQKFILYRKRKVFVGKRTAEDLAHYFNKYKAEKFLLPCSNLGSTEIVGYLDKLSINHMQVVMYKTVSADLSDLSEVFYDVLAFFSPQGIESLFENFPDFKQNNTRIAVFGNATCKAAEDRGLFVNIKAPTPEAPSMTKALENYIVKANGSK
ncbi:MAG TPA: uroporphyrinogen-III synthase [Saprospiraceae bacterium]|jgi:uroporphyrinogen-III synthase|nr:uroporphyrinogen-III synthase [Saprospiraceae bacterium]MBK6666320.1 uroporphyrinogen-III synthase [Saprospiraceae bacterium]MBK8888814.1 uroporphyrinogen-III synthase [Saprospiraceae bacterium]MBK9584189.1 uroporphyrinogen-III synthase [Saprospiraceae bacterium]MBK9743870.1 uroporphyrinogen-III synthase [Saprospiraceae bacterium]